MSAKDDYFDRDETAVLRRYTPFIGERQKVNIIQTPHGYVIATVHVWPDWSRAVTMLAFAFNGRLWTRTWEREWRPRTITTLAREFVGDVIKRPFNQE